MSGPLSNGPGSPLPSRCFPEVDYGPPTSEKQRSFPNHTFPRAAEPDSLVVGAGRPYQLLSEASAQSWGPIGVEERWQRYPLEGDLRNSSNYGPFPKWYWHQNLQYETREGKNPPGNFCNFFLPDPAHMGTENQRP